MRASVERAAQVCPVEIAVAVLGGAWKLTIVKHLLEHGVHRTHELHRRLPTASERTLTRQLRELEEDGIIQRTVHPQVPPKVEYALTELGTTLREVVQQMDHWGATYGTTQAPATARTT